LTAVDGTEIFLDGGYDRKGENRIALSSSLAALVAWPTLFVNDVAIPQIEIEIGELAAVDFCHVAHGSIDLKDLSEHFSRGINRFSVTVADETAEVLLDVEM